MTENPPYVNAYGQLPKLFEAIITASVPPKVTQDFLYSKLEMKSTSHRPFVPFLKRLGFLDESNTPTQFYKDYRDRTKSKIIMADCIRKSYSTLYESHEYAHTLGETELISKMKTITGLDENNKALSSMVGTFKELCKLADFENKEPIQKKESETETEIIVTNKPSGVKLGISYTINLNLPATTEIEVFNAIFKSLKEHILHE